MPWYEVVYDINKYYLKPIRQINNDCAKTKTTVWPEDKSKKSLAAAFEMQLANFENNAKSALDDQTEVDMNKQDLLTTEELKANEEYALNYGRGI